MDHCAKSLHEQFRPHILLSYGFSDQFSFVLNKSSDFCGRNLTDILSVVVSSFTSNYVFNWRAYFDDEQLKYPPAFKGSTMLLPSEESLISYLLTKQHECYILNLNATLYSALIGRYRSYDSDASGSCKLAEHQNGNSNNNSNGNELASEGGDAPRNVRRPLSNEDALNLIKNEIDSISKINEFLFKKYAINYNNEPELFRKGSLIQFDVKTNQLNTYNLKLNSKFLSSVLPENGITIQSKTSSQSVEKGVTDNKEGNLVDKTKVEDLGNHQSASGDPSLKKLKTAC